MIESTGPKISSWAMVMSLRTSEKIGRRDVVAHFESFGRRDAAGDDPRAFVDALIYVVTHSLLLGGAHERSEQARAGDGVVRHEARGARGDGKSSTSLKRERGTTMRVRAEQVWPEFR